MSVDGTVTGEYTSQEAIGGADVVLTIDANLQEITERALEENIMQIRNGGFGQPVEAQRRSSSCNECKNWRNISYGKLSRL